MNRIANAGELNPRKQLEEALASYLAFRENDKALLEEAENGPSQGRAFYRSDVFSRLVGLFAAILGRLLPDKSADEVTFRAEMLMAMLKSDIYRFSPIYTLSFLPRPVLPRGEHAGR